MQHFEFVLQHSSLYVAIIQHFSRKYELALRSYEGDDPLSVWHSYINWTEQNYPSGGKSSQLTQLLKACVMNFKNTDQYNNDDRFVQIWIHFVSSLLSSAGFVINLKS